MWTNLFGLEHDGDNFICKNSGLGSSCPCLLGPDKNIVYTVKFSFPNHNLRVLCSRDAPNNEYLYPIPDIRLIKNWISGVAECRTSGHFPHLRETYFTENHILISAMNKSKQLHTCVFRGFWPLL